MGFGQSGTTELGVKQIANTFAATRAPATAAEWFMPRPGHSFNLSAWGTFSATLALERSFDAGTTWIPVSRDALGTAATWTAAFSTRLTEEENGVLYRLNCTYTSGTANYRFSQ